MAASSKTLRQLIAARGPLVVPFAFDALSARLIERAGCSAVGVSGSGLAASLFAVPDIGLPSMAEVARQVANIADATDLPVIADADNGYGNHVNVWRTVREFEKAGAAGLFIEDQQHPKRCGHYEGVKVVPAEEMVSKVRAAVAARRSAEFVIVARTDARQSVGFDEAVRRGRLYREAGADVVFVEAPCTREELAALPKLIDAPLMVNMVEGGKTPILDPASLGAMGYSIVIWPDTALAAAARAMERALACLRTNGTSDGVAGDLMSFEEMRTLLRHEEYGKLDRRFGPQP